MRLRFQIHFPFLITGFCDFWWQDGQWEHCISSKDSFRKACLGKFRNKKHHRCWASHDKDAPPLGALRQQQWSQVPVFVAPVHLPTCHERLQPTAEGFVGCIVWRNPSRSRPAVLRPNKDDAFAVCQTSTSYSSLLPLTLGSHVLLLAN